MHRFPKTSSSDCLAHGNTFKQSKDYLTDASTFASASGVFFSTRASGINEGTATPLIGAVPVALASPHHRSKAVGGGVRSGRAAKVYCVHQILRFLSTVRYRKIPATSR